MSGASEQANGQASGPVLMPEFSVALEHSAKVFHMAHHTLLPKLFFSFFSFPFFFLLPKLLLVADHILLPKVLLVADHTLLPKMHSLTLPFRRYCLG